MRPNVDQALLELEGVDPPLMCSWSSTAYIANGQSNAMTYVHTKAKLETDTVDLVRISFISSVFVMYTIR